MLDVNEIPTGRIDSSNKVYVLSKVPVSNSSVKFWLNGVVVEQGVDYTVTGNTITTTLPPMLGSWLFVEYLTQN